MTTPKTQKNDASVDKFLAGIKDSVPEAAMPVIQESPEECPKCGSNRVVPNARLGDQGQHSDGKAHMIVSANPSALLFKGGQESEVFGKVCCDCGHVELRCRGNLDNLWTAYLRAGKR